jgi:hypothetical protein
MIDLHYQQGDNPKEIEMTATAPATLPDYIAETVADFGGADLAYDSAFIGWVMFVDHAQKLDLQRVAMKHSGEELARAMAAYLANPQASPPQQALTDHENDRREVRNTENLLRQLIAAIRDRKA